MKYEMLAILTVSTEWKLWSLTFAQYCIQSFKCNVVKRDVAYC